MQRVRSEKLLSFGVVALLERKKKKSITFAQNTYITVPSTIQLLHSLEFSLLQHVSAPAGNH
jgi:hypothetical protein